MGKVVVLHGSGNAARVVAELALQSDSIQLPELDDAVGNLLDATGESVTVIETYDDNRFVVIDFPAVPSMFDQLKAGSVIDLKLKDAPQVHSFGERNDRAWLRPRKGRSG